MAPPLNREMGIKWLLCPHALQVCMVGRERESSEKAREYSL